MRALHRVAGVRQSGGWAGWMSFAVVFGVAAAVVATGPIFVAAVADVVAEDAITGATDLERTVQLQADAFFGVAEQREVPIGSALEQANAAVLRRFESIAGLEAAPTTFALGGNRTSAAAGEESLGGIVRIVSRSAAFAALEVVAGGGEDGVWLSQRAASILGVGPGDTVSVTDTAFRIELPVSAVYRDLDLNDFGPYWSRVPQELLPREFRVFGGIIQPELFVVAEETLLALDEFVVDQSGVLVGRVWWQAVAERDLGGADGLNALAAGIAELERAATDSTTEVGAALGAQGTGGAILRTSLVDLNADVTLAVDRIGPAIAPVRVTGVVLGLGVIGLGAWFVARRRVTELRVWLVAGRAELGLGAAAGLGSLPPAALGTMTGAAAAPALVRWLGPSQVLHTDVVPVLAVVLTAVAGVAIVGTTTAAAALRLLATGGPSRWARAAWEAAVYVVAAVLLVQLVRRDPEKAEPGRLELATVLAPVVAAAALATVGARALAAGMARLRRLGSGLPPGVFLAWRRLAAASAGRIGIVLPIAVAAAVALFSSLLVATVDDGLESKSVVAVGSEVSARLARVGLPDEVPVGMTLVWTGSASRTADSRVMLMVVDTDSYPTATLWPDALGLPFTEVRAILDDPSDRVPVVVAGRRADRLPAEGSVRTQAVEIAYRRVVEIDAVPAMSDVLPTMLVSRDRLAAWAQEFPEISGIAEPPPEAETDPDPSVAPEVSGIEAARALRDERLLDELLLGLAPQLLSTRDAGEVEEFLARAGQPTSLIETRADLLADGTLTAQRWAFDYMRMLAMAALALSFAVLGFAMIEAQRRMAVSNALARRMGVSRAASAASLGSEIVALVAAAVLLGCAAGWVLAAGFLDRFDPLPTFPPGLRTITPLTEFGLVAAVAGVGAALVWWLTVRAIARIDPAEVLRD